MVLCWEAGLVVDVSAPVDGVVVRPVLAASAACVFCVVAAEVLENKLEPVPKPPPSLKGEAAAVVVVVVPSPPSLNGDPNPVAGEAVNPYIQL